MLSNLIFSLNATMPLFLMMVVGYVLKRIGFMDAHTTDAINKLVFRVFLPLLLFEDLAEQDFLGIWDGSFVLFCFAATVISIIIAAILARLVSKDPGDFGEIIQASYRSGAATLGIAFMTNIYDNVAMVALMIIGSVPLYNAAAVLILSLTSKESRSISDKKLLFKKTLFNVITNPIILGILVGTIWSLINIELPFIISRSVSYLGNLASPLALISLGATFEFADVSRKLKEIILCNVNKLFVFCMLFLPVAIWLGYRDEKLVAALIMLGSATTSSSFIMSKNMGHEGVISAGAIMTTTLFSSFTLTLWLFVLRSLGYI